MNLMIGSKVLSFRSQAAAMQISKSILNCECGAKVEIDVCLFIDVAAEPELCWKLVRGELNVAKCKNCGKFIYPNEPFTYFDARRGEILKIFPPSWKEEDEAKGLSSESKFWTRTLYGLDALINFIAAGSQFPREYRDLVADQAQTLADEYHAVSENVCGCGLPLRVERSLLRSFGQSLVEIIKARCSGCGEAKSFFFTLPCERAQQKKAPEVPVPLEA